MSDILMVTLDDPDMLGAEKVVTSVGMRCKSVCEISVAKEWLTLRSFDALITPVGMSVEEQQELASLLWEKNHLAYYLLYSNTAGKGKAQHLSRLFGSEVVSGLEPLKKRLTDYAAKLTTSSPQEIEVLVVEDLDSPRDIICSYVETFGFKKVTGLGSAKEALALLESSPEVDFIVLTDVRMPEIAGDEFIRMVRAHTKLTHLPIIVLTANGTADCLMDCLQNGASGFLVKPPKKRDLLRELSRACRILAHKESPRLASAGEVSLLRDEIEARFAR